MNGEGAGALRVMTSYFPGWRATDESGAALPVGPSTDMGLLTVDVPAGARAVTIWWAPTGVEWAGSALTILTLTLLAAVAFMNRRARPLAGLLALLLAVAVWASFARPPAASVAALPASLTLDGVTGLGARINVEQGGVWVFPYWRVDRAPSADLRVRWQVQSADGKVVLERESRPYHNATSAADWPPNTLVDDAYFLPLPDGLPRGAYTVSGQLVTDTSESALASVGEFALDIVEPRPAPPAQPWAATFGDEVALLGYDPPGRSDGARPSGVDAVARAGDTVAYTLHWEALASLEANYHGFVHLLDSVGDTLAKRDQLAGAETRFAPLLWGEGSVARDRYPLRIPPDATSGVYWPAVGLYNFETLHRLPVTSGEGAGQNAVRLRPLKVLGAQPAPPEHPLDIRIGDLARLTGYDLALPAKGLAAGDTFTLTLRYQVAKPTDVDYTRFLHFYSPALGMGAQQDGPPAGGRNPTWAWVPGETVTDRIALTVSPAAASGTYQLRVGLYDPAANAARLPLTDGAASAPARRHRHHRKYRRGAAEVALTSFFLKISARSSAFLKIYGRILVRRAVKAAKNGVPPAE